MVEIIYNQLKTPKSIEELHQSIKELGINWNKEQLELFLLMDSNVNRNDGLYSVASNNPNRIIIDVIDNVIEGKPLVHINKIMENIPNEITVSAEEIIKVAEQSGRYNLHSNRVVLMRKKN